jgi:hypothetical protein
VEAGSRFPAPDSCERMPGIRESPNLLDGTILADSSNRLRQFHTRTILVREQGRNVVYKVAATKEALAFLELIGTRERENAEYLKGQLDVLCGSLRAEGIRYEHLPQPSLAQSIGIELGAGHCDRADELLGLYVRKIHALEHRRDCPSEFLSVIAGENPGDDDLAVDCLSRGLLDLSPRNILVDGDRWVVIDNEWSFEFPVPRAFLLFRAIRELCLMRQAEIRRTTSLDRPAVGLLAMGLRTYYFPKHWIEYSKNPQIGFSRMLRWEAGFRQYVAGSAYQSPGYMKMRPRETTRLAPLPREDRKGLFTGVRRVLQRVLRADHLVRLAERRLRNRR